MTDGDPPASTSPDPAAANGRLFEFNRPTVVGLCFIATYFTGFSAIVGVILAYVWRTEAEIEGTWEASHYTYLIRTFWLGLFLIVLALLGFIGALLGMEVFHRDNGSMMLIVLSIAALAVIGTVWMLLRCIVALVKAQNRTPIGRPRSLLV